MPLFQRKSKAAAAQNGTSGTTDGDSDAKEKKANWRRPANTAFKQQRLKAWQPILTPRTVLPTLFLIGLIFAPIGGLLIWGSNQVSELTLEYTGCQNAGSTLSSLPNYNYNLRSADSGATPSSSPQWMFANNTAAPPGQQAICTIEFNLPADFGSPVFMYYKLTNFYQNHRRYVKSMDTNQLKGNAPDANTLSKGNCPPLDQINGKAIYPCGLIANSVFNDTFTNLTLVNAPGSSANTTYNFTMNGIAWPGESNKYVSNPGYTNWSTVTPPPNWVLRYPNGYNSTNYPDLANDELFQNWMRTAGLPTFTKLYGRNDTATLQKGTYTMQIYLNFPVEMFGGTKSIVISTVSWIGGKNPFLGWAYVGTSALFILLAVIGTAWHCIKPRRLGDMSLLSWNQPR